MRQAFTLFVGMFTTLLAIVHPLETLPIFLKLLEGRDEQTHREVARRSCRSNVPAPSAGFARATESSGEVRKGGDAPLRVS